MSIQDDLTRNYRVAFLRYLPRREEAALHSGYELGRSAVVNGVSMLELVRAHHEVLIDVLRGTRGEAGEVAAVAGAASDFFIEVLSTYDMTQRGVLRRQPE
ncbi:MAG: hypothetical protein M3529_06640 [Actinomycetota bacterium]|nr:hypothetical protein [Actinomycetota bacterium]MDQ3465022.1 hypothetical protein [Actinomycetota bacterium]